MSHLSIRWDQWPLPQAIHDMVQPILSNPLGVDSNSSIPAFNPQRSFTGNSSLRASLFTPLLSVSLMANYNNHIFSLFLDFDETIIKR